MFTPEQHTKKKKSAAVDEPCFYQVLQIEPCSSTSEVRKAYRRLARQFHPDRRRWANPQAMDCMPDGLSDHDMFSLIARAYEVLIDPTKRATYDMLHGHNMGITYTNIGEMRRRDAEQAVDLMKVSFDLKRRAELARGGLVIDDAIYGPRTLIETRRLEDLVLCEQVVNVTRQLQCVVEGSKLVLPANEPKHSLIPGLYDPCDYEEKLLCVRYYFRGKLHRVVVSDLQRLVMPLRSHCISGPLSTPRAPPSLRSGRSFSRRSQASKPQSIVPLWAVASIPAVLGIGTWLLLGKSRQSFLEMSSRFSFIQLSHRLRR